MSQNIQVQQAALIRLRSYLETFKEELTEHIQRYRSIVDGLHQDGLSDEIYNTYLNNYYERDRSYINQLISHMDETDVPYLSKTLETLGYHQEAASNSNGAWDY